MKGLFHPDPPSAAHKGNGSLFSSYASLPHSSEGDADVSMDDSHASAMSGVTTESMTISSPPRTQRRKRNSGGTRHLSGNPGMPQSNGGGLRSRLFEDEVDLKDDNHGSSGHNLERKPSMILKPLDLNQEFNNSEGPQSTSTETSVGVGSSSSHRHNASSLTPRPSRHATMALRKRQAEQHDLYGNDWNSGPDPDSFSVGESPVDMYTSPRISPSTPSKGTHRPMSVVQRSPFYPPIRQGNQSQNYHKSPSHFQTLDGRTVQSKNPFSPMIFDDLSKRTLAPGNSPAPNAARGGTATLGLTHPLLLTTDSLSEDRSAGKPHLVLRHKLQKRVSSPCNNTSSNSKTLAPVTNHSSTETTIGLGISKANTKPMKLGAADQEASLFIRDGYPEATGQYSFTGSPIKEHFATKSEHPIQGVKIDFQAKQTAQSTKGSESPASPQDNNFCTNIHKLRRRSKGEDVGAAASQGGPSWKKKGMYIQTFSSDHDSNSSIGTSQSNSDYGFYNIPKTTTTNFYHNRSKESQTHDGISPTDVMSFPQFKASPSDTTTLPPTPSKPIRKPPVRRYTPIRKTTGPPPTPMPAVRQARSFEMDETNSPEAFHEDSSDDDFGGPLHLRRRRRRRPNSISPKADAVAAKVPSRFYTDFDVIDELGSGSFGNVFKALSRLDGCLYAIKVAHRVAKGNADRDRMLKEVYALAALSDQMDTATFHIVRYHQAWMENERLYIQTELCTTTLQAEMQKLGPQEPLPLPMRIQCLREILLALQFIHKNNMVHLDIKPENIFLKNGLFKLGDFGLVSKVSSHDVEEGDSRYMSMELLSGDHSDLTKSDIFSLGIAVYEICMGSKKQLPSNGPEWQALRSGNILPPSNTTDALFQIIKKMMNPTYQERPCASELLELPELLSEERKLLNRERAKVEQANQALQQSKKMTLFAPSIPAPRGMVRRNTWSAF